MDNIIIPMQEMTSNKKKKPTLEEAQMFQIPFDALLNTVIVVHIAEPEKEKKGGIYVPDYIKEQMAITENMLVKALVKSVGINKEGRTPVVAVGDVVYVYPGGYGAKIFDGEAEYLVYAELDMIVKLK